MQFLVKFVMLHVQSIVLANWIFISSILTIFVKFLNFLLSHKKTEEISIHLRKWYTHA